MCGRWYLPMFLFRNGSLTLMNREDQNLTRAIKEALFIRVNDPFLILDLLKS